MTDLTLRVDDNLSSQAAEWADVPTAYNVTLSQAGVEHLVALAHVCRELDLRHIVPNVTTYLRVEPACEDDYGKEIPFSDRDRILYERSVMVSPTGDNVRVVVQYTAKMSEDTSSLVFYLARANDAWVLTEY